MRSRMTLALMALFTLILTALPAGTAYADDAGDRARARYGIALEGGGVFAPGVADLGSIGVQGQLGVQFNDLFAVYGVPNIDFVSGWGRRGLQVGGALMFDFTIAHVFTIGVGPDLAGFVASGAGEMAGGIFYGTRLRLAVNPLVDLDYDGRRRGLTIGLDLRLSTDGGAGVFSPNRVAASEVMASPTLSIGYQAF